MERDCVVGLVIHGGYGRCATTLTENNAALLPSNVQFTMEEMSPLFHTAPPFG